MTGESDLDADDRREFARQRAFLHLDSLSRDPDHASGAPVSPVEEQELAQAVLDALFGMGRLQALVDDDSIENIDINGCDQVWATFADGSKRSMGPVADSDDELVELLRSAAGRFGLTERRFDTARPELDLQLPGGARLSAVMAVALARRCPSAGTDSPTCRSTICARWVPWTRTVLLAGVGRPGPEEHRGVGSHELREDHAPPRARRRDRPT